MTYVLMNTHVYFMKVIIMKIFKFVSYFIIIEISVFIPSNKMFIQDLIKNFT